MKISEAAKKETQSYKEYYNQTLTSQGEVLEHTLECPQSIITLAKKTPDAEVIIYGDDTLGIEINGKVWAVENHHPPERKGGQLPREVWHFINMVMGREEYRDK